jgi:hypothetical protein
MSGDTQLPFLMDLTCLELLIASDQILAELIQAEGET